MSNMTIGMLGAGVPNYMRGNFDSDKEYAIEFDEKGIVHLKEYLNVVCNILDYNDFVFGNINKKLYEYNKNIDTHIENNVLIIDKMNLKTFKLHLALVLNEIEEDDEYKEFLDEINYLSRFLDNANELL